MYLSDPKQILYVLAKAGVSHFLIPNLLSSALLWGLRQQVYESCKQGMGPFSGHLRRWAEVLTTVQSIAWRDRQEMVLASGHVIGVVARSRRKQNLHSKALRAVDWHPVTTSTHRNWFRLALRT